MVKKGLEQFLQSSGKMNARLAEVVAARFQPREVEKGAFLLREGKVCDEFLFLDSGFLRAFVLNTEGEEVTTGFYKAGGIVFEVASFFHRTPSRENIQALTGCSGWAVSFTELNALFHGLPQFREFGRHLLVQGYAALKERMLSTITEPAETRYARLLHTHPEILQQAPLKYVASFLGITDSSLSRIRREWAKK